MEFDNDVKRHILYTLSYNFNWWIVNISDYIRLIPIIFSLRSDTLYWVWFDDVKKKNVKIRGKRHSIISTTMIYDIDEFAGRLWKRRVVRTNFDMQIVKKKLKIFYPIIISNSYIVKTISISSYRVRKDSFSTST